MNSGLLNVWRETSALVRFADAKCAILLGVNTTLIPYISKVFSIDYPFGDAGLLEELTIITLATSVLFCVLALIPTTSMNRRRVRLYNIILRHFAVQQEHSKRSIFHYLDIAKCADGEEYLSLVLEKGGDESLARAESNLDISEDIWRLSQLARYKFGVSNIATLLTILTFFALLPLGLFG
ncbi:hypothetical protein GYB14_18535 [bacterium]|nr:hypothetical protein [bacterium]